MKRPPRISRSAGSPAGHNATRTPAAGRSVRRPYVKPRIEEAGSVFSRTRALGPGSKDVINGSSLL
jgi:hypothetical protein